MDGRCRIEREGVDEVGVASGDGAELVGMGAGPEAGGEGGGVKAESAGGEEGRGRGRVSGGRTDEEAESAAGESVFFSGDRARVGEAAGGSDERRSLENLGGPGMREGEIELRRARLHDR